MWEPLLLSTPPYLYLRLNFIVLTIFARIERSSSSVRVPFMQSLVHDLTPVSIKSEAIVGAEEIATTARSASRSRRSPTSLTSSAATVRTASLSPSPHLPSLPSPLHPPPTTPTSAPTSSRSSAQSPSPRVTMTRPLLRRRTARWRIISSGSSSTAHAYTHSFKTWR